MSKNHPAVLHTTSKGSYRKKLLHNENQKCHKLSGNEVPKAVSFSTKILRYGTDSRKEEQATIFTEGRRALLAQDPVKHLRDDTMGRRCQEDKGSRIKSKKNSVVI